jgi:hypothetical protein
MTLPELHSCLDRLGIKLSARLVVDAPAGVLTSEVKTALAFHKLTLLAALPDRLGDNPRDPPPWPPRPAELANWPIEKREAWGRLANDLNDQNIEFPECERRAFNQLTSALPHP